MSKLIVNSDFNITSNMNEVKAEVENTLAKYENLVFTVDTVKDAKKNMAEINGLKKEFKETCKGFLNEIEAPLVEFKKSQKEVESLYDEARTSIKSKIEVFEANRLNKIKKVVQTYIDSVCIENEINKELINADEFTKLAAVTTTMKLAKATKDLIDAKVSLILGEIAKVKLAEAQRAEELRVEAEKIAEKKIEDERKKLAMEKAKAEDEKAKMELENQLEQALTQKATQIKNATDIDDTLEFLNIALKDLRGLRNQAKRADTLNFIDNIGLSLKAKIEALTPKVEVPKVEATEAVIPNKIVVPKDTIVANLSFKFKTKNATKESLIARIKNQINDEFLKYLEDIEILGL